MQTIWIEEERLSRILDRNESFWKGELEEGPITWVTAPGPEPPTPLPEPAREESMWTDPEYVVASVERGLAATHYAGDALPVFNPWLGPDQFAGWLGGELTLLPKEFTSWTKPFVENWDDYPELTIDPQNRWWKVYLETLAASAEAGKGKWVTGYPDLHTGIDAISAIRGPERLAMDLVERPETILRAMRQLTGLWKHVVDTVSDIILPAGQGASNWTMGWSEKRFLCIGQNDFSCMISPEMFDSFCLEDTTKCCNHVDYSLYHLDGPGAVRHVPRLLEIESLTAVQWIQGAGNPPPSAWLDLLKRIQGAGKLVQVYYGKGHGGDADLHYELETLCRVLDPDRLFFWAAVDSSEEADSLVAHARKLAGGHS
ncbi:MAG: hypothetical protein HZB26_23240 [Candidatus Hydrogenedentes bacterium]|nr:hypothetical protein [Candidatus Hydrogenedentota bacterium]